jgi:dihydroorotate dehydrogenase (NAD+) catalytic subunit
VSARSEVDLSVQIGSLRFSNPIIAASGTFGYGVEFAHLIDLNALGGIVTKGLSLEPMEGAPAPRICETPSGMLNAVGLQNIGVRAFVAEKLPELRKYCTHTVCNVFGHTISEYVEVIRVLNDAEGISAYELNVSCPNTDAGGIAFGVDPAVLSRVVELAKSASTRPIWVKLSPNVSDIRVMAKAAEIAGADALTVANTYPAMAVDTRTNRSRLGRLTGGLSGPAIKPITLRLVFDSAHSVQVPIIGLGGIESSDDVIEYLAVGATAVQIGTATFSSPRAILRILNGFQSQLLASKANSVNDLTDVLGQSDY